MDTPKPRVVCPECGSEKVFFHCALQNDENEIYDWGTLVTCLECKTPFAIKISHIRGPHVACTGRTQTLATNKTYDFNLDKILDNLIK